MDIKFKNAFDNGKHRSDVQNVLFYFMATNVTSLAMSTILVCILMTLCPFCRLYKMIRGVNINSNGH